MPGTDEFHKFLQETPLRFGDEITLKAMRELRERASARELIELLLKLDAATVRKELQNSGLID